MSYLTFARGVPRCARWAVCVAFGAPPVLLPGLGAAQEAQRAESAPSDAAPPDAAAPLDAAPSDTAPSDAAPSDAAPSDAAPSDAAAPLESGAKPAPSTAQDDATVLPEAASRTAAPSAATGAPAETVESSREQDAACAPWQPDTSRDRNPNAWRDEAYLFFDRGEHDKALAILRDLLERCLALDDLGCQPRVRAILFRDVGIVLAGGARDHDGAVRAFRGGLKVDMDLDLPAKYQNERVNVAYAEARYLEQLPFRSPYTFSSNPGEPPAGGWQSEEDALRGTDLAETSHLNDHFLFELSGQLQLGSAMTSDGSAGAGNMGARVMAGGVTRSSFAGGLQLQLTHHRLLGYGQGYTGWGPALMLGSVFKREHPKQFRYVLGGMGFEHYPEFDLFALTTHVRWAASLNGLGVGLGFDLSMTAASGALQTDLLVGFHMGYLDLL